MQRRVALPLSLSASALRRPKGPIRKLGGASMGTGWSVHYAADSAPAPWAIEKLIASALQRVIAQMSSWDETSSLSRFQQAEIGLWHAVPPELAHVIKTGQRIAGESNGAYDITLGHLVNLWGFGPAGPRIAPPLPNEIASHLLHAGTRNIEVSPDGTQLRRLSDLHLDLSGIAKGFAVDLVAMTLRAQGITDCLIEIGGELVGRGVKPDGTPWWVDIDTGSSTQQPIMVGLHELAIATSGAERAFYNDGKRYTHTIDPRSGWPLDNGMVSVTVLHKTCMEADAYATALMVLGPDHAIAFADAHKLAALIRYQESPSAMVTEQISSAFRAMLD